jgi:membrane protein YqaA with SNARE-associated domain
MALFEELMNWSQTNLVPYGELGLFLVAFAESSFFPIPPDLLLIPLVLAAPELGLWYAFICLVGSVLGAIFGYYIGLRGGRPALQKLVSEAKILRVENYFKKYGEMAVGIAALTPIPYKVFTISAGIMKMDLKKVIIVSILGRGGRFFPLAIVLMIYGQEIIGFLNQYFEIVTMGIGVVALVSWIIWKKFKNE